MVSPPATVNVKLDSCVQQWIGDRRDCWFVFIFGALCKLDRNGEGKGITNQVKKISHFNYCG